MWHLRQLRFKAEGISTGRPGRSHRLFQETGVRSLNAVLPDLFPDFLTEGSMKFTNKILPVLVMALSIAIPSFAQPGSLHGKVVDTEGKPMVGVTISIDRQGITQHFEVKTDNKGQFLHAGLPTGQYQVSVTKDGKTLMTNDRVTVSFGGDAKTDFDLKNAKAAGGNAANDEERKKIAEEKAKEDGTK